MEPVPSPENSHGNRAETTVVITLVDLVRQHATTTKQKPHEQGSRPLHKKLVAGWGASGLEKEPTAKGMHFGICAQGRCACHQYS